MWVGDPVTPSPAAACGWRATWRSLATMERVTGIGGVFQRAGQTASLRAWYAEHLGIDISDWGGKRLSGRRAVPRPGPSSIMTPSTSDGRSRRSW